MIKLGSQSAEAVNSTCAVQFLSLPGHMKIFPSCPEVGWDHVTNSNQLAKSRNEVCTCVCTKSFQLCPTFCDPVDCSLPDPLSMEFSRQEYWNGLPFPPPGDHPDPRYQNQSSTLQSDYLLFEPPEKTK